MTGAAKIWLLTALAATYACGGTGSGGDDDDGGGDDGGGGVITPEVTEVTGQFFLGDLDTPAVGHEVWIIDHDAGTYLREDLDPTGGFSVPIESFTEDHVYSLEMVRDYQSLGPIDLSEPNAGVQSGFLYRGGYGFDLGQVVMALDQYGRFDPDAGSLQARVGGGFSLSSQSGQSLASMPLPDDVTSATLAAALVVTDPQTALAAFYRRDEAPELYHRALAESTRVEAQIMTSRNDMYEKVVMLQAGTWLTGARLATGAADWATAARWSDTKFEVPQTKAKEYQATAFVGRTLPVGSMAILQLHPKSDASRLVPAVMRHAFTMPPRLTDISTSAGAVVPVEYTSPVLENGLTRPFCRTAAVNAVTARPLDGSGALVTATDVASVTLSFDYYGQADGRSVALTAKASDYPGAFDEAFEDTSDPDVTRAWDPSARRLTLTFTAAAMAATTQAFSIWDELFLASAGGGSVFAIRVRLSYVMTDGSHADTVFWFDEDC